MEFSEFVRKPFTVEATEVTTENIAEVAELIGALKEKENGTPYIAVDRRLVPNLYRVYPGFWLTRMGDNIRCYSKRVFKQQFVANNAEIQTWVDYMNEEHEGEGNVVAQEAEVHDINHVDEDGGVDINVLDEEIVEEDVNTVDA